MKSKSLYETMRAARDDDDARSNARSDLESALVKMSGLARTMALLGEGLGNTAEAEVMSYFGNVLFDYHEAADRAFHRIFGIVWSEAAEKGGAS